MIAPENISRSGQYTTAETATLLGVHRNTLRRYVVSGVLKCSYRRGNNRPFFKGADLITFCKSIL